MKKVSVTKTPIDGLYIVETALYGDERGYFTETYNRKDMEALGLDLEFVQDNQSLSRKGVLRGMHYQKEHPQGKLIRVVKGEVFDVAIDLRKDSPTYLKWYGEKLSDRNRKQFYISKGFAHGYVVLSDEAIILYKCTDFYHPEDEGGIAWNDPDIAIEWPDVICEEDVFKLKDGTPLIINERDRKWSYIRDQL